MHMHLTQAMLTLLVTLVASIYLITQSPSSRTFPITATIVTTIEVLLAVGVMSFSLAKLRLDVILPALLALSGIVCWTKSTSKGGVTAATSVALVGSTQLLLALHLFG